MHRSIRLLHLTLALLASLPATAGATAPVARRDLNPLSVLIPTGDVTVDVLTPDYDRRTEDIAVRLHEAARRDPAWFQAWTRRHPRGSTPYHPKLGVTRAEYAEFQLASRSPSVAVSQRATLRFEPIAGARRWRIRGWGKLTPLDGLVLDLDADVVTSPRRGRLLAGAIGRPAANGRPLVPWRWFAEWHAAHQLGNPARGGQSLDASLHIGPTEDGFTALYWTYRRINPGAPLQDEFLLVRWRN